MVVPQFRPRIPALVVTLVAVLGLALAVVLVPAQPAAADDGFDAPPVPDSPVGDGGRVAISPADRDFVMRVRLAGLWEMPAGAMAVAKGTTPRVREVGKEIAAQHVELDRLTREAAAQLNLRLPDRPLPDQQDWLNEMQQARGTDFDRVFVLRLRQAHGQIFPAIGTIRSGTHNDVVRRLAQQANQYVMTHLTLLESTGLVDYADDVPIPPDPAPLHLSNPAPVEARAGTGGAPAPLIWSVLSFALLAGGLALTRVVRPG